jgi:two-component system chemotaxis response regulator CheB
MSGKIKVLIVDDSALVRRAISDALAMDPEIEVVGTANDPLVAQEKMPKLQPDVITLDMEMPRMDGLTFLKILQQQKPMIPVVVVSSLTQQGSAMALAAMEAGARDVLAKPDGSMSIGNLAHKLAFHVKAAARARRIAPLLPQVAPPMPQPSDPSAKPSPQPTAPLRTMQGNALGTITPRSTAGAQPIPSSALTPQNSSSGTDRRLIVIGSSTGGVEALRFVLPSLPGSLPPIAVAQHIPPFFSKAVANRINEMCGYEVREAGDDEELHPGLCVIAPGDFHLTIVRTLLGYKTRLTKTPPVHYCRPAVDVLFRSAADAAGSRLVAVLLTGMGSDGAMGMQAIKAAGGSTIAEHEDTCVVYGMPRAAVQLGVVDKVMPLDQIPSGIIRAVGALAG